MSDVEIFTKKLLDQFSKEITDQVFVYIQNDKDLMHDYLKLIRNREPKVLNSSIAKAIKKRFDLTNQDRKGEPKSVLIQSYEEFA